MHGRVRLLVIICIGIVFEKDFRTHRRQYKLFNIIYLIESYKRHGGMTFDIPLWKYTHKIWFRFSQPML